MLVLVALLPLAAAQEDPNLWLEEVENEKALEWAEQHNEKSTGEITADPGFDDLNKRLRAIYDSDERIPYVSKRGDLFYNFWKDADHAAGIWRRTTLDSYRTDNPEWELLLDLDALNEAEGENWVWHGSECLPPLYDRCLLNLSRGGADATVVREYDVADRAFVEGGFGLPEAKNGLGWIDLDTVYVGHDFGDGTMTDSGYPKQARIWKRGTPLESAEVLYDAEQTDISAWAWHDHAPGYEYDFVYRGITFYSSEIWLNKKGKLLPIDKQDSAEVNIHRGRIYLELREDWDVDGITYKQGSLLAADFKKWMKGKKEIDVLFEPTERTSLAGYAPMHDHVLLNTLDNVKNKVEVLTPGKDGWNRAPLPGTPAFGNVRASSVDPNHGNEVWLTVSDYVTPTSLMYGEVGGGDVEILKQLPALYDAEGLAISQHEATSKDGTKIPYFQVAPEGLELDGTNPTLLYGYGGFEVSLLPKYSSSVGAAWLEKGGVYVVANIRGGGEFGPRWHQAALKANRHKAYEDFIAVGEDLVSRKVTSTPHLGIAGGSNGGLLMGNMLTLRPDLWGAILCKVPLLDMQRYHTLLAGASWMGEYGDPDIPEEWKFIQTFSPYHNVDADTDYPPILITTSTRDDRVHPGHARKMTAKLEALDKGVLYYENIEGGHGGAANNEQKAFMGALGYSFLWNRLNGAEGEASDGE